MAVEMPPTDPEDVPVASTTEPVAEPAAEGVIEAELVETAPPQVGTALPPMEAGLPPVESALPPMEPGLPPVETTALPPAPVAVGVPVAADPAATGQQPQYVVVEAPRLPRSHGNRGIGSILAVLGAVIFGGLLAVALYLRGLTIGVDSFAFVANLNFYVPIVIFAIAFVLLVLIVNRGAWWTYILGSLVVAVVVYFGTAAAGYGLAQGAVSLGQATPDSVASFGSDLTNPFVLIAAILSREVAIWWGSLIAHRGRRMTVKNAALRESFDQQLADFHERYGQTAP